ncbi:hypothetical protein, partial [Nocardioides malaquae]|uniref:hypothetical protein n=1 Tax=Nocardioides malaquae TaxID=2773426 RepID=UPI001D0D5356
MNTGSSTLVREENIINLLFVAFGTRQLFFKYRDISAKSFSILKNKSVRPDLTVTKAPSPVYIPHSSLPANGRALMCKLKQRGP